MAKYCVSAVAQRGEMTLLAVVMGAPDAKVRFKDAAALLDYGFGKCNLYLDENRKNPDPVPIKGGVKAEVSCRYTGEFRYLDTEGKNLSQIEKKIVYMKNLQAPVKKGDIVGEAQYLLDGKVIGKTDIVAAKSVKKAGLWDYIKHIRKRMIKGDDYLADRLLLDTKTDGNETENCFPVSFENVTVSVPGLHYDLRRTYRNHHISKITA